MSQANMTELDAVNRMLLTISEQKVNSLESSGVIEVDVARDTLQDVSREVQGEGWRFNTEHGIRLKPDINGNINLPANCLAVWRADRGRPQVEQRGIRLYNLTDRSYTFKATLVVSAMYCREWEELIPAAKTYIVQRACRQFQEIMTGSQVTEEFVLRREAQTRTQLEAADARNAGYNMLTDNRPSVDAVMRDRW